MISKYLRKIYLKRNLYAVFNSLMMDVLYCTKQELKDIMDEKYEMFSETEKHVLYDYGIWIRDKNIDQVAMQKVRDEVLKNTNKQLSLMYLIPCNYCNLKCRYCFIGKIESDRKKEIMNDSILYCSLQEFSKHLKNKKIKQGQIIFYGAEPLMGFEVIKKTCKYIEQNNLNIQLSIITNATLLNDEVVAFLTQNNISIGISIDGPKRINDKNRIFQSGKESVYDCVIDKIELLKKYNANFGLSITITDEILKEKKMFLEWLGSVQVNNISYNLMHYTEKNDNWRNYYKEASKFLIESSKILPQISEDRINRKVKVFNEGYFKYSDCAAIGGNQICVGVDGNVSICHGFWNNKKYSCGNILDGLDNIFETNTYRNWNTNLTINKTKCQNCPAISICGGGCAMQSEVLFGDSYNVDETFCIYTKTLLKYILLNQLNYVDKI